MASSSVTVGVGAAGWLGLSSATWLGLVTVIAVLLGPILAVQAQKYVERRREKCQRRLWLFRELMATRGSRLSQRHVEALNIIELEYDHRVAAERPIYEAWRLYFDALNTTPTDPQNPQPHYDKRSDRFDNLMYEMSRFLGYVGRLLRRSRPFSNGRTFTKATPAPASIRGCIAERAVTKSTAMPSVADRLDLNDFLGTILSDARLSNTCLGVRGAVVVRRVPAPI